VLTCPVNVSEGADPAVLDALRRAAGTALADLHADVDHHRAVLTLVGAGADELETPLRALARTATTRIDLRRHRGVHPRLGALDVVPFVALPPTPAEVARAAAEAFAAWLADELRCPVFRYGELAPDGVALPVLRRRAFRDRRPDLGPDVADPRTGATAVGVRPPLVAVNAEVDLDPAAAAGVAAAVRATGGGLPGVRALAFHLPRRGVTQVSMNVTDVRRTSVEAAVAAVEAQVTALGGRLTRVELVGLVPCAEWERWSEAFRTRTGLDATVTVEERWRAAHPGAVRGSRDPGARAGGGGGCAPAGVAPPASPRLGTGA
jgi:glutamate formiminotransferase/glutamate formiminotransferase/formiminotetrahydrofolate cyclodeaminase